MVQPARHRRLARIGATAISRLYVEGFKSISQEQAVELRPVTILAGANSSGKSSMIQPLLLLKQTLDAPFDAGALLLDGPNVRFSDIAQLLSKPYAKQRTNDFTVGIEVSQVGDLRLEFSNASPKGRDNSLYVKRMTFRQDGRNAGEVQEFRLDMDDDSISRNQFVHDVLPNTLLEEFRQSGAKWIVSQKRCFLTAELQYPAGRRGVSLDASPGEVFFSSHIQGVIHLPGLRGTPERTYKTSVASSRVPGTFDSYVASVVRSWQERGSPLLDALGSALEQLGLTWKVTTRRVDDTRVELLVAQLPHARTGRPGYVSLADVGIGVSQTLPVIVALLLADPGQLVYLEQPEIHLHPNAQIRLANVIADAARRGVRIVIETHSSLLLRGIQTLVADGTIDAGQVILHWFSRDSVSGSTKIDTAELDENGAFGSWPEDFDDVALDAESRYLDAVGRRVFGS